MWKSKMLPNMYIEKNHFMTYNSIIPVHAGENDSLVRTELKTEGMNLSGYAHGGLLAAMADTAAGIAARGDGRDYVTQSLNINYISNIRSGQLCARGEVVHRGKTITVVRVRIENEAGKLLVEASANMFCTGILEKQD